MASIFFLISSGSPLPLKEMSVLDIDLASMPILSKCFSSSLIIFSSILMSIGRPICSKTLVISRIMSLSQSSFLSVI